MEVGIPELVVILFVLAVVFSASRMGKLGDALGKFVYSFRRAARGQDTVDVTPGKKSLKGQRGTQDAELEPPERR
jgi:sec-independent protein translocase protein TatA